MPDIAELVVKIRADASQLTAGLAAAGAQVQSFAVGAGAAAATASEQLASKLTQGGMAAQHIGTAMTTAGVGIVGALGVMVAAGTKYQNKLLDVFNNTLMTKKEFAEMDEAIRRIAKSSPASLDELANGFMRSANFGFKAGESVQILEAAMKSAVATGAKTDATANALAGAMKAFGFHGADAVKVMNELHLASALGNSTLEQFTAHSGRAHAAATVLGVRIEDVDSALSALTRHQFNPANAETGVLGMMSKIVNPAQNVKKLLDEISKKTGIDLVNDFTGAGIKAKGLQGIIEDIRAAAAKMHTDPALLAEKLVPAQRGGLALAALTKDNGFNDKTEIMGKLQQALSGQLDATVGGFNDRIKTLSSQLGILRNQFTLLGADIQRVLVPALLPIVEHLRHLIERFDALPPGVKRAAVQFAAIGGVSLLAGGALLSMGAKAAMIAAAFLRLAAVIGPLAGEGGALASLGAVLTGPVGIAIAAIAAAVALLAVAWKRDWGHIREVTAQAAGTIGPVLAGAWQAIAATAKAVWGPVQRFLMEIWPPIQKIAATTWNAIVQTVSLASTLLKALFEGTWTHIATFFRGIWDVIAGIAKIGFALIRSVVEVGLKLLTGDWAGAWKSCQEIQKLALDGIGQLLKGLVGIIGGIIGAITQTLYTLGKAIVEGIWIGIQGGWRWLVDQVTNLVYGLIATVKQTLGIASPSTVFAGIGHAMGLGLAHGIGASRGAVHSAFGSLMSAADGMRAGITPRAAGGGGWVHAGAGAGAGGGAQHIHVNMVVHAADAASFHRSQGQMMQNLGRAVERHMSRNG